MTLKVRFSLGLPQTGRSKIFGLTKNLICKAYIIYHFYGSKVRMGK